MIFDDVEIPRDRLFIDGHIDLYNIVGTTGLRDNMTNQTTIRALTKLEFAYGLAVRMAEAIGDSSPATQEMLGELLDYVEVTRSAVLISAEHGRDVGNGVWFPDGRPLNPMRSLLATWFPRVNEILMLIGSHNLLAGFYLTSAARNRINHHLRNVDKSRAYALVDGILAAGRKAADR